MSESEKELVYKLAAIIKAKFFFCNNYDDAYYQFTDKQMNDLVEKICNSDDLNTVLRKI